MPSIFSHLLSCSILTNVALLTASSPASNHAAKNEIGELWLETSKIARKAGHSQTAYSAILQARDCDAEFAFYQSAKLLKAGGQTYKAIQELDNPLKSRLAHFNREDPDDALVVAGRKQVSPLAKVGPLSLNSFSLCAN